MRRQAKPGKTTRYLKFSYSFFPCKATVAALFRPRRVFARTVEEVVLTVEYLADLQGPDLSDSGVGRVQHEGLHGAVGGAGGEDELVGVALHVLLQTEATHLQDEKFDEARLLY